MWAHAEYIKLLRSASDGKVFDLIPAVADRYQHRCDCTKLEIWKPNRRIHAIQPGGTARATASYNLRIRPTTPDRGFRMNRPPTLNLVCWVGLNWVTA